MEVEVIPFVVKHSSELSIANIEIQEKPIFHRKYDLYS